MERILAVLLVSSISLSNCVHREVIYTGYEKLDIVTIHEKVGKIVGRKEQEKYRLFGRMQGFDHASFYGISGGGYVAKIITARGVYHAINRDPDALVILHDVIELRERIAEERKQKKDLLEKYWCGTCAGLRSWTWEWEMERKWKIKAYDGFGFPITQHEIDRYKDGRAPYLGALGCLAFGAPLGAVLGCVAAKGEPDFDAGNPEAGWALFTAAVGVSIAGGVIRGNKCADMSIIKEIRKAREPKRIE